MFFPTAKDISNHSEQLPDTPSILCFFLFTGSPAFFGPHWGPFCRHFKIRFKQRSLSSMLLGRISWDVRWLGDRNFMTLKIHIHIHPYPPISIHIHPKFILHRSNMHGYVSMYLCIYVSMYLCIYVSMYLCIYVSMYLSDFIKQAFQPCPVQPALVLRWTHPAVTQVLITKPASMPALAKLGKILGKRWGASLGAISQPCLAAGLRFQFHLWVDTCWHPYNALNHPWSSSSSSRASRCYCPIH